MLLSISLALLASQAVVQEPAGACLVLEDGVLERRRGGIVEVLGCTDEGGPGRIHGIAADPAGLAFVAAERGLYVLGPEVADLDRVRFREGAPPGEPRSVVVDERRRVWLATDLAVGVIEPSFGWGRTIPADDLGVDPPYRLELRGAGVWVHGSKGERELALGSAEPPAVVQVSLDSRPVEAGARVPARYGKSRELQAAGTARGGATFRYRVDGHHVWRSVAEAAPLDEMNPGVHRVEVIAMDQELNASEPFVFEIEVSLPFYFGKAFVLLSVVLAALLTAAVAFFVQRPGASRGRRLASALASTVVALVFGLQMLAGLVPHAKGWPFVGYSMYSESFDPERPVHRGVLVALDATGVPHEVPLWRLGYRIDSRWQVLRPIATGGPAAAAAALDKVRAELPEADFRALQVRSERTRLTPEGPRAVAPLVLSHYQLPVTAPEGIDGEVGR